MLKQELDPRFPIKEGLKMHEEHFLPKFFNNLIPNVIPREVPLGALFFLIVETVCVVQVLREAGGLEEGLALLLVEVPGLLHNPIFEVFAAVDRLLHKLLTAQEQVYLYCLLQYVDVNEFLVPFLVDRLKDRACNLCDKWLENVALEYFETLVCEGRQRIDLYVETIEVLEEALHPANHYAVVAPFYMKFLKQVFSRIFSLS